MRVKLFESRTFDLKWPEEFPDDGSVTVADQITIHCERLDHKSKRNVEDSMFRYKATDFQRNGGSKKKTKGQDVEMQMAVGSIKDLKIGGCVTGWENVLDDDGAPIPYTIEKLYELLATNAGLSTDEFGSLEATLLDKINEKNTFSDQESPKGNS